MSKSQKSNNNILEQEIRSILIMPLRDWVMDLETDSSSRGFSPQQQLQVYLYLLDPKTSSLEIGSARFNLYAEFLESNYDFDIRDNEIAQIRYLLGHETARPEIKISKPLSRVVYNRCLDVALDYLQQNNINRDEFSSRMTSLSEDPSFDMQRIIDIDVSRWLLEEQMHIGFFKARKLARNFVCILSNKLHENDIVLLSSSFYINRRLLKNALITAINKEIIEITPGEGSINKAKRKLNDDFLTFCTSKDVQAKYKEEATQWWTNKILEEPMAEDVFLPDNLRVSLTSFPAPQRSSLSFWQKCSLCVCKKREDPTDYARLD